MITNRQMWLLILIVVLIAAGAAVGAGARWLRQRTKQRASKKREDVRQSLLSLDMASLTPIQEMQARYAAREAGLNFDDLDTAEDKWLKQTHKRDEQMRLDLLAKVKAERIRQETLEREAIESILNERPEPRPDEH